jgi:hypothetical protein
MSRTSSDQFDEVTGRLMNGFDYDRAAWVKDGRYVRCGHPESMRCPCYGRKHQGEPTQAEMPAVDSIEREAQPQPGQSFDSYLNCLYSKDAD